MTIARSLFTEAIEDHLALKKQNAQLNEAMPVTRYDVGDPLERYPGGPVKPATDDEELATSADAHEAAVGAGAAFGSPAAPPLGGMTPALSLVEDLDDVDSIGSHVEDAFEDEQSASVLRFPGGTGPRDNELPVVDQPTQLMSSAIDESLPMREFEQQFHHTEVDHAVEHTGEHPVIVIDAEEPLAPYRDSAASELQPRTSKRSWFRLRRKGKDQQPDGWFNGTPPGDFRWDD